MIGISDIDKPIAVLFTQCHKLIIPRMYDEREGCSCYSRRFSFQQNRLVIEIADLRQRTMYVT